MGWFQSLHYWSEQNANKGNNALRNKGGVNLSMVFIKHVRHRARIKSHRQHRADEGQNRTHVKQGFLSVL